MKTGWHGRQKDPSRQLFGFLFLPSIPRKFTLKLLKLHSKKQSTVPVPFIVGDAQRAVNVSPMDMATLSTVRKDAEDKLTWLKDLNTSNFKEVRMKAHNNGIATLTDLLSDLDELKVTATTPTVRDGKKKRIVAASAPAKEPNGS